MSERWLVWGGGGHGRVVADAIRCAGGQVVAFVDRQPLAPGTVAESVLLAVLTTNRPLPLGATRLALGIGDNASRARAAAAIPDAYGGPVVHPTAFVASDVILGVATVVLPKAVIHVGAELGPGVIVNSGSIIEHDCVLGSFVHVSPGAVLAGGVRVETEAWIGASAVVVPGVTIGARSIVGAGSVVLRDVPAGVVVAGNPARLLRPRERNAGAAAPDGTRAPGGNLRGEG